MVREKQRKQVKHLVLFVYTIGRASCLTLLLEKHFFARIVVLTNPGYIRWLEELSLTLFLWWMSENLETPQNFLRILILKIFWSSSSSEIFWRSSSSEFSEDPQNFLRIVILRIFWGSSEFSEDCHPQNFLRMVILRIFWRPENFWRSSSSELPDDPENFHSISVFLNNNEPKKCLYKLHQITLLRVIPTPAFQVIYSDRYFGILPNILSDIYSDILPGISSSILCGIYIFCGVLSGMYSGILCGILSRIYFDFYVAFYVAYILAVYLAYILAVFLAYILAFHLAAEVQRSLSSEGPRLRSSGAHWARKVPGWGPAVPTALRTLRLRSSHAHSDRSWQLRSSSAHCVRKLAKSLAKSWQGGSGHGSGGSGPGSRCRGGGGEGGEGEGREGEEQLW